jgi:hypothetical protein
MTQLRTVFTPVFALLFILGVGFGSSTEAQAQALSTWQQRYDLYKSGLHRSLESELVAELRSSQVLFVTGILAQSTYEESEKQIKATLFFGEYFKEVMQWLTRHQIKHQRLQLESEESPEYNAQTIRRALRNATKPVVVFSHSKGGLDFLEAIRQEPELAKKVRAWVCSQSPLWGSSIAEILFVDIFPRWLVEPTINFFFGGSFEGAFSLTTTARRQYMQREDVQNLFKGPLKNIPKLSYSSFGRQQGLGPSHLLVPLQLIMEGYEGPNDGVVSMSASYLPSSAQVRESGVDHISTVVDCYLWKQNGKVSERLQACKYDRLTHAQSLLKLVLEIEP